MKYFFLITVCIIFFSCSNEGSADQNTAPDSVTAAQPDSVTSWRELTESWNASLNMRNASIMKSFYADSVLYYGDQLTSEEVVIRQQAYFNQNKDYHQKIEEQVDVIQQPNGSWLVKIIKRVTAGGKTANYPASLVYAKSNGIWKIIAESDDITDLNKATAITVQYKPETSTVEGLLEENTGFGKAEGGDPKSDAKETYYVVWSKNPLDVIATAEQEKSGMTSERNVERVQVTGDIEKFKNLLNRKVRITGKLFPAENEHHHTKVVMQVELIEEVQ